jgi:hypothetical protein
MDSTIALLHIKVPRRGISPVLNTDKNVAPWHDTSPAVLYSYGNRLATGSDVSSPFCEERNGDKD